MREPEQMAAEAPAETKPAESKPPETERPETKPDDNSLDRAVDLEMAAKTRRSLLVGGLATLAGLGGWEWLRTRRPDDGVIWPLRLALGADEELSRDYFRTTRLARTFAPADVEKPRENGDFGLDDDVDPDWKLTVEGASAPGQPLSLTLDQIKALPKVEMITQLNCIEGWSRVLKWGGVRFRDFARKYAPGKMDLNGYVGLETPDRGYYVGLDMPAALHPQTLLCYEMNGEPLPDEHGAPLRLVIPVKYGIKNLKRIGKISFTKTRPPDFWAERGYDWYAGF
jgi:DMSO/TMAO reductase YedYZ molybdopterin-dependent catalytic subunit